MVFQLVYNLFDIYATVGSQICHYDTLPPFYKARSMVVQEEMTHAKQTAITANNSTFLDTLKDKSWFSSSHCPNSNNNINNGGRSGRGGFGHNHGGQGHISSKGRCG